MQQRRRRSIVTASPSAAALHLASSHWLPGANMLMTEPNAGLLSSHLPSCAASTHFYHCYGNGLLFIVARWLAGWPVGRWWRLQNCGAEEHQDGRDWSLTQQGSPEEDTVCSICQSKLFRLISNCKSNTVDWGCANLHQTSKMQMDFSIILNTDAFRTILKVKDGGLMA